MSSHRQDNEAARYKKGLHVKVTADDMKRIHEVKKVLRENSLNTVCEKAKCPNMPECFKKSTATFIILGKACTRNCAFCSVVNKTPGPIDMAEPQNVANAVKELALSHVVITSVTRDDLPDRGIMHFIDTVREIKNDMPDTTIEVLTPDFDGLSDGTLGELLKEELNVFGHNVEMVKRLYPTLRKMSDYGRSLALLQRVKRLRADLMTKSAVMLGLGENKEEVTDLLGDIRQTGCDIVVIGQYLQPTLKHAPVKRFVSDAEFLYYEELCYDMGFKEVYSFPKARSSYAV
jgi:lipoic acid synthetase